MERRGESKTPLPGLGPATPQQFGNSFEYPPDSFPRGGPERPEGPRKRLIGSKSLQDSPIALQDAQDGS
eukprot:6097457-Pyramimonas_sp.AAC.1